ncbi:MAG: hypothetical protein DRP09_13720 [Candidatus Thorarchaeota archaeon]|nr:MAG: hypothetical protein DRP09_13720 [Candidatus Thorarchaeota archaeon]
MELNIDEIERYIEEITTRQRLIEIDGELLFFKQPTVLLLQRARFIRDREYRKALNDGFLSKEDIKKVLEERNIISDKDKAKLTKLYSQLEAQKVLLAKTTKVKANQDRIKKVIAKLENDIAEIENKEKSKLSMSADVKAEESKIIYLCWSCTYSYESNELYWPTLNSFLEERRLGFRQKVLNEFIVFHNGFPTDIIRAIARSNLWRIRYMTSIKTSETIFGVPTSEYTPDMLNLLYWSHYYQNIYEMLPEDRPPDFIIDDDEALDAYMEDYYKEHEKEVAARRDKKRLGNSKLSAFDQEEVIVTRSHELYEDIEYDKPREAQVIKDRNIIRKRARRG